MIRFLLFVNLGLLLGCNWSSEEKTCDFINFESKGYKNSDLKLNLKFPVEYTVIETDPTFQIMAYKESNSIQNYVESLGINFFKNDLNQSLDEIYNSAIQEDLKQYNLSEDIIDFKIDEQQNFLFDEKEFKYVKISYREIEQIPLTLYDFYYVNNNFAYKFTFACNQSDADSLKCKFIEIMNSVHFN